MELSSIISHQGGEGAAEAADVLVLPECEMPDRIRRGIEFSDSPG